MFKKLSFSLLVFIMVLSLSFFLGACAKKVVKEDIAVETEEEPVTITESALSDEESRSRELERERAAEERRLREEALRREREEAARRAEITKKEAQIRQGFENSDVYFDFDRYFLTNEAREILADKASWLLDNPDVEIEIEGHCDERGTNEYNMALGERRSDSALKYLVNAGVKTSRISSISYGEEKPLDPGHDEIAWAKNRRAHFRIVLE